MQGPPLQEVVEDVAQQFFADLPPQHIDSLALFSQKHPQDDFVLLDHFELAPAPALLPADPAQRAVMDKWIAVANNYLFPLFEHGLAELTGTPAATSAISLSRATMSNIRQNLGWSALYNFSSIPLALMGLMPPWLAGLGMALSSLGVVLNALRLGPARR